MRGSRKPTDRKASSGPHRKSCRRSASRQRAKLKKIKSGIRKRRKRGIGKDRLERGLRVFSRTKDANAAARSIHVSVDRFKRAAKCEAKIRKQKGLLTAIRRLPRRMPIFSGGRQIAITVKTNSASLIGRYMAAVRQFLRTNDPKYLAEFRGLSVKDARGKAHPFETDPNNLYRLSSAGNEPFEDIYRIVI